MTSLRVYSDPSLFDKIYKRPEFFQFDTKAESLFHLSMFFSHAGYSRSIPGNPRYKVLGTDEDGIFSLQIDDVQLEDDADYECQVGPANYNRPIRHPAHLHVQRKT